MSDQTDGLRPREQVTGEDIIEGLKFAKKMYETEKVSFQSYTELEAFVEYLFGISFDLVRKGGKKMRVHGQKVVDVMQEFMQYEDENTSKLFVMFASRVLCVPEENVTALVSSGT